ncbi:metal ABC transporter permease [Rhodoligotrophos defluvii]|uniref:metal ABC transporter permease n=1 Tax=Rhodoligotrophos defluvii TaxID=2561934 RepID=UPI0010C9614C|nr:metal ABC transporter permease [Rhodoligotrophos defluvii]
MGAEFVMLNLVPLLVGVLVSLACALLGNFLILRRQALIGDAVSHVVLLGIVGAFILTGSVAAGYMLAGAAVSAVLSVMLIELIRRLGRVEPGAAMGVVFTALFALGVFLLEQAGARSVHLDVEHALYGNLESLVWFDAQGWHSLVDPAALAGLPPQVLRLGLILLAVLLFILSFWKELFISTFDHAFGETIGARPGLTGSALIVMVAAVAVMSFDAVGAIIVIAMFICPAGAARLMTDRLPAQLAWSAAFAVLSAVTGYVLAAFAPLWLGFSASVSAAGMIAVTSGLVLLAACLFGPRRARVGA